MIFAAAVGYAIERTTDLDRTVLPAVVVGMVVAMLIPTKGGCSLAGPRTDATPGDDAHT
ncbi:MAG: hypothetical protein KDC98_19550 [Planctomycetes bacterium]|nr:hypothetical protein [Planctomycetota bacterium]